MNVLFIIFNRPEVTARVFEQIRQARPTKLFIAADGPRKNKQGEDIRCKETRDIISAVNWPCEVTTRFQEKNLGCKIHVSSSISWFFDNVEEGIILEDDCLPSSSFFTFCSEMLERYRDTPDVMTINGGNFLPFTPDSLRTQNYHFSRCPHIWGWATWRRAWKKYDLEMTNLDTFAQISEAQHLFHRKKDLLFWSRLFRHIRDKKIDTWDAQWVYSIISNSGYAISPHINMVENIGFGPGATHTLAKNPNAQQAEDFLAPYLGPNVVEANQKLDLALMKKIYNPALWKKITLRVQWWYTMSFVRHGLAADHIAQKS